MNTHEKIDKHELLYNYEPMPFVIRTIAEIDKQRGGITDKPHRHNYYTVLWSFTATGRHIVDFKEYPIRPNDIFFVSPQQVHQVIIDSNPDGYTLQFTPEFLERNSINKDIIAFLKLFNKSDETPPLVLSEEKTKILRIFADKMMTAFRSKSEMFYETIGAYLKLFLIECYDTCSLSKLENIQSLEPEKGLFKSFKTLVETHFHEWHQVKSYAEALFVSPNYLNEVIQYSIYTSAKEFIQNRIALEAKRELLFTEKSAKEIGFDLGFEDPSHFSKFFKSQAGQTFQEFKNSAMK